MTEQWSHDEHVPLEFWDEVAALPGLRPVLDYADADGAKNELIDRLHRRGLGLGIRSVPDTRYRTAIDFGCGIGRLTSSLSRVADRVIGVDPSEPMLARARQARSDPRVVFMHPTELLDVEGPALVVSVYVLYALPRAEVVDALRALRVAVRSGPAHLVAIERMARAPGVKPRGIESRDAAWYATALDEAGWRLLGRRNVRRSGSIPLRVHHIATSRLPASTHSVVSRLVAPIEFARAPRASRGDYVDVAFWAQ